MLYKHFFAVLLFLFCSHVIAEPYVNWSSKNFSIDKPLTKVAGNADKGKQIIINKNKGNCLACHRFPIDEESFHGNIGPSLIAIGTRLNAGQIRLRVVNQKLINPATIMPGYYKDPQSFNRIDDDYINKTVLTAQEVEDVVAYLVSLKQE